MILIWGIYHNIFSKWGIGYGIESIAADSEGIGIVLFGDAGYILGSSIGVYLVGDTDNETESYLATLIHFL